MIKCAQQFVCLRVTFCGILCCTLLILLPTIERLQIIFCGRSSSGNNFLQNPPETFAEEVISLTFLQDWFRNKLGVGLGQGLGLGLELVFLLLHSLQANS
jgi:hypothetical protein